MARFMYDHGIEVRAKRSLDAKGVDRAASEGEA